LITFLAWLALYSRRTLFSWRTVAAIADCLFDFLCVGVDTVLLVPIPNQESNQKKKKHQEQQGQAGVNTFRGPTESVPFHVFILCHIPGVPCGSSDWVFAFALANVMKTTKARIPRPKASLLNALVPTPIHTAFWRLLAFLLVYYVRNIIKKKVLWFLFFIHLFVTPITKRSIVYVFLPFELSL
jgi:hypothetical protein